MTLNPKISSLLLRWEQLRAQGQIVTADELCHDCPDLLGELINGLHALQASFHTPTGTPQESSRAVSAPGHAGILPAIGDYKILGELGRGGIGVVYQAYDLKRKEMIALKTLQRLDASAVYRLKQEFRALAEVTHPNLVGLYELSSTRQQCFIAMELIDGHHFLTFIRSRAAAACNETIDYIQPAEPILGSEGATVQSRSDAPYALSPYQYELLRESLRQLALGVSALHTYGKLHRDIKPSNVMVTREGRVVLLDFGLVAQLDWAGLHQSTQQHVTGTIAYMAPEQAASQKQSRASDWYSVGVMLYEALTGRLPFTGTPLQVLMDKQQLEPPIPAELAPGIPEDLNNLCVALLRKSPEARPVGDEVLQRLGAVPLGVDVLPGLRSVKNQSVLFVGRESHTAELMAAFQAIRKGRAVVVRLHGRSGAGKSMLAQHFLEDLLQHGNAVVLAGKCYERESVPYKALDSLIDALSRYLRQLPTHEVQALLPREVHLLARVFPVLQRVAAVAEAPGRAAEIVDPHELRRRSFAALRELFARLGDRKPLVLFIDDLQWGDLDGATQLAELLRPPDAPVFMLLACYRSEDTETSPCLGILHRALEKAGAALDQRHVSVDPLGHKEACELALALLGRRDSASQSQADTIARESGGNPFFVHVLVQGAGGHMEVAEIPPAGTLVLDEVLWTRIQTLADEPRRLLEVIAVSGQPLNRVEARQAARLNTDEHGALAVLRSGRLIRSSGSADLDEVETYHDRIRETILSHLPANEVQDLHRQIAVVLESAVPSPDQGSTEPIVGTCTVTATAAAEDRSRLLKNQTSKRLFDLAYHFDAAGNSGRAFPYAMAMAEQARSQYALEIAEQLYRIAERGAEKADYSTRYRVAESLGDVLMLRGRYPDAAIRFKAAMALTTDTLTQAQVEGKLAELSFKYGDMKTATETTERALRMLGNRVPCWSGTIFCSLCREAIVQALHTLLPTWFLARKSLEGAEKQRLTVRLHNRLAYCYWFGKGKIPCLWSHLRGMNLAEAYPPTPELGQAYSIHAPVMGLVAYFNRGIAYAQKSLAVYKAVGDLWGQGQSLHFYGVVLYAASRYDECVQKCRAAMRLLERTGDLWEVNIARYHIANSLYRLGELGGAVAEAKQVHQLGLELGDIQGMGICMDVWAPASGGRIPSDVLQTEFQRPRNDVQVTAQLMFAEGVRLFMLDRVGEAADVFDKGYQVAAVENGVKSAWTYPLRCWLTSSLRRQAEKTSESHSGSRDAVLKRARKTARQALRTARSFQNDLPHALRECGLIAALQGQVRMARQHLDESLAVAERQGARFEHARTLLARGQVGQKHGWPEAQQDLTMARQALRSLGADFALDDAAAS
jgi:eukaryotic-like serine/threonine-protein kinase